MMKMRGRDRIVDTTVLAVAAMLGISLLTGVTLRADQALAQQQPLVLLLSTEKGTNPIYHPGEFFVVTLRANQPAFAQCYYAAGDGSLAMIFPNAGQPDNVLKAGEPVVIPPEGSDFKIRFSKELSFETIACFGTVDDTRSWIPANLSKPLETIPGTSLDDVEAEFLRLRDRAEIAKSAVTAVIGQ